MKIRTNIFISVFLATIVPLTALALGATYYSETSYRRDVAQDIRTSLDTLAASIKRLYQSERDLALGLARSPAVSEFLPVLYDASRGRSHSEINVRRSRINRFFEGFQTILPGLFFIRIVDANGSTLIKVSNDARSAPVYESLSGIAYVEQELNNKAFKRVLADLPYDEVSVLRLPHTARQPGELDTIPILDYVIPLRYRKRLVGGLAMSLLGEQIDRLVDHAPRLYKGRLFLVEINPDEPQRHGLILYDETQELRLSQIRKAPELVTDVYSQHLLDAMASQPEGQYRDPQRMQTVYYSEFFPHADRLASWVLASRVEDRVISAPFNRIRAVIWALAGCALLISLVLAGIGVRTIAQPVSRLAHNLKGFADGDRALRAEPQQSVDEIAALAGAFNYLADTVVKTEQERDSAQNMLVQQAKLASIGQMAAGIGHELNNPLNNILSYAKLIQRNTGPGSDAGAVDRDVQSLRDEAVRASDIVKGILNFARQVPPHYAPFRVSEWIDDTLALVRQAAKDKNLSVRVLGESDQIIEGDRGQLQQALINLLLNAIHASARDGQIVVGMRTQDNDCVISVRDEGEGIDEEALNRVFDPFFSTRPEGEGTGLGLSISLGIVEHHSGRLEIANNPDRGVTATMILPSHAPPPVPHSPS
ncbi:MAG: sensor histidine kinase [Pseudomonadota bacterium]|nr:MAG: sensor histidine kinase [Pseudomonadota bacterium]